MLLPHVQRQYNNYVQFPVFILHFILLILSHIENKQIIYIREKRLTDVEDFRLSLLSRFGRLVGNHPVQQRERTFLLEADIPGSTGGGGAAVKVTEVGVSSRTDTFRGISGGTTQSNMFF